MRYLMSKLILAASAAAMSAGIAGAATTSSIPSACGKQWTVADTDNDGQVSFEEGQAFADKEFARLDQNGDGNISSEEFARCSNLKLSAMIANNDNPQMVDGRKVVNGMVMVDATVDSDKDNQLSRQEVLDDAYRHQQKMKDKVSVEDQARYTGSWFAAHDTNHDGMVSMEESTAKPDHNAYTSIYDKMDSNNDGNVTSEEWSNYYKARTQNAQEMSEKSASSGTPVQAIWYFYVL